MKLMNFFSILLLGSLLILQVYADTCVTTTNVLDEYSFIPSTPTVTMKPNSTSGLIEFAVTVPYLTNGLVSVGFWNFDSVLDRSNLPPACTNRAFSTSSYPSSLHTAVVDAPDSASDLSSSSFAYPSGSNAGEWIRETTNCHTVTYRASFSIASLANDCARNGIPATYMRSVSTTSGVTYTGTLRVKYDWVEDPTEITSEAHTHTYEFEFNIKTKPSVRYLLVESSEQYAATSNFTIGSTSLSLNTAGYATVDIEVKSLENGTSVCSPIAIGAPQAIDFADLKCSCSERCATNADGTTIIEFVTTDPVMTLAVDGGWTLAMTDINDICDEEECEIGTIQDVRFTTYFTDSLSTSYEDVEDSFLYARAAINAGKVKFLLTDIDGYGQKIAEVYICTEDDLLTSTGSFDESTVSDLVSICDAANVSDGIGSALVTISAAPDQGIGLLVDSNGIVHPIPYVKSELQTISSYDDWTTGHLEDEIDDSSDNTTDDDDEVDDTDDDDTTIDDSNNSDDSNSDGDNVVDDDEAVSPDNSSSDGASRTSISLFALAGVVVIGALFAL